MVDWPEDMIKAVNADIYMLHGGYLYNGWPIAEMREAEIDKTVADIVRKDIKNIAIASAFSPMNSMPEMQLAEKIRIAIPDAQITLSHNFGRLGLMERENAAIMNTTLLPFADKVVSSFLGALSKRGLRCPAFISQNDGTLMSADFVRAYPALTFASGPTNSLRGAYKLTGLENAIVVDIGGTTSDIGVIQNGFPRESNVVVNIGGIRTNFRMPDILAIGLGGGSIVSDDGKTIGPKSVGHKLVTEGLVFGGRTLTTSDILVASGHAEIGNKANVAHLSPETITQAKATMHTMLNDNIEMMKPGGKDMPVILVGGGAVLVTDGLKAASKLHRPENAGVANAIGAAIAQVGGETERMLFYREIPREAAIASVTKSATARAIKAGADPATIRAVDIEETAVPYMGIPVVDGDGMGRALPEAQMMSYAIAGVRPTPAVALDYAGNVATFQTDTTEVYERHIRSFAMAAGGMITTAEHAMSGAELKRSVIPETLSFSIELGRTLRENRGQAEGLVGPLQEVFAPSIYGECRLVFQGKVIDKATRIVGGYDVGEAMIERFDGAGSPLKISIKNEYLLAAIDTIIIASVPDLIVIVDLIR